jgi:hypothetical protein
MVKQKIIIGIIFGLTKTIRPLLSTLSKAGK